MRLTIPADDLYLAAKALLSIVPAKSSVGVGGHTGNPASSPLTCLRLEAADDTLTVIGTDLDTSGEVKLACDVIREGVAAANARDLTAILRGWRGRDCELWLDGGGLLHLRAGKARARLTAVPPNEIPVVEMDELLDWVDLDRHLLNAGIGKVFHAVSQDDARPATRGAYLKMNDLGSYVVVATDGHRLAQTVTRDKAQTIPEALVEGVIIPRESLVALQSLLSGDYIRAAFTKRWARFEGTSRSVTTRLINASYPNYDRVIPDYRGVETAQVDRRELLDRLQTVGLFAPPDSHHVLLDLSEDALTLSTESSRGAIKAVMRSEAAYDKGRVTTVYAYDGPPKRNGINHHYLRDALQSMSEDQICLMVGDGFSPCLLLEGEDLYLIMPTRF